MRRFDVHRPSMAISSDYMVLAVGEVWVDEDPETGTPIRNFTLCENDPKWRELSKPDQSTWIGHRDDQCDHCGAHIRYFSILLHVPTGDTLKVGLQCTGRFFGQDWTLMKQRVESERIKQSTLSGLRESRPKLALAVIWADEDVNAFSRFRDTAKAILKGCEPQDWQINKLLKGYDEHIAKGQRAACGTLAEVPVGRIQLSGTIQTIKVEKNPFGSRSRWATEEEKTIRKVLLVDDRGFKVWGTLPAIARDAKKGDRLTFSATCEKSSKDPEFGTFSRPLKCEYTPSADCAC